MHDSITGRMHNIVGQAWARYRQSLQLHSCMQTHMMLYMLHTDPSHHACTQQDRWLYTHTAESTLTTAHKWLGGPYSIATKVQVTAAFLPFVLLPVVGEPAVPLDKMSIQTCGLRTRCPQDEMSPPHLRLTRVGIARDWIRSPLHLGSYQFIANQFFWEPAPHYSVQVDW